ncbi:AAA family ATPase [Wolbachia endosymbiont of Folsomia candida]|uniref:AAA family ATPase n=1 Tax=Wolbachia endosymbiont of Folsomia candida TaxID=169402 RepID=UPI000AE18774|nr:AAA family ATPase [Wolbachia endosymbiont of Folsomia candida]APR99005.1 hypothetical protein ASM33_07415 [Wolbachia endosymbiont of Folsomia candida]
MLNAVDFSKWKNLSPKKEFVLRDKWLYTGNVSFLKGKPEAGKSLFAQQLITAVATGKPWLGERIKRIKTYGVFCEDSEEKLWTRQCAINRYYCLNMKFASLVNNVRLLSRVGKDNLLMVFDDKNVGHLTPYFEELLKDIRLFQPKLVVLDEVSDFFGGDENNSSHVKQFVQKCCAHIARKVNCAVLLCKHGLIETGVWRDTMKFHMYAYPDEEGSSYLVNYISRDSKQK